MKLLSLRINQLPGISEPFSIDLDAQGVIVISGPNASGKSSLLRALSYLLTAPLSTDPVSLSLEAVMQNDAGRWQVARSGSQVRWHLNGKVADRPPRLPSRETLQHYLLNIDSLLAATDADTNILAWFAREMAGGYDLPRVRESFAISDRKDRNLGKAAQDNWVALQKIKADNNDRVRDLARLPQLEQQITQAQQAQCRLAHCDNALELLGTRRKHQQAERALADFPVMPDEQVAAAADELGHALRTLHARLQKAQRDLQSHGDSLAETALDDPQALDCKPVRQWIDDLRHSEQKLEELGRQQAAARAKRLEIAQLVSASQQASNLHIDAARLATLEDQAQQLYQARQTLTELRAQASAQQGAEATTLTPLHKSGLLLMLVGAIALATTAWLASPVASVLGGLLLMAGLLLTGQRWWSSADHTDKTMAQRVADAERTTKAAETDVATMASELGLSPQRVGFLSLMVLPQRLRELESAQAHEAAISEEWQQRHQDAEAKRTIIGDFLTQWQMMPEQMDAASLSAALDRLQARRDRACNAQQQMQEAQRRVAEATPDLTQTQAKHDRLYRDLGLAPGDRSGLDQRLAKLPEWRAQQEQAQSLLARTRLLEDTLAEADADIRMWVSQQDDAALLQASEAARTQATQIENLQQEIQRILAEQRLAERELPLEQHRNQYLESLEELAAAFEARMCNEAAHLLLDEIEQEHQQSHQPETLRLADDRLRRFTQGSFALLLDAGQLCAMDLRQEQHRELHELSVGTRMQLLIAIRTAWIGQCELSEEPLPLFLDEALTTTDAQRFQAIASALAEEARLAQRQILYLTAQREDLQRWAQATGTTPAHRDMTEVRQSDSMAMPDLTLYCRTPVPDPTGMEDSEWGRLLEVEAINPNRNAGAIAVFHLLRDQLALAHQLMDRFRVTTLGQLEGLLQTGYLASHLHRDTCELLQERICIVRAWVEGVQQGRGRAVDRTVLEAAPAVTPRQLDGVAELADQVGHDARQILEGLRQGKVKRFHNSKIEQLEAWLLDQGYLDPRPLLSEDERYRRALSASRGDSATGTPVEQLVHWLETACPMLAGNDQTKD